MENNKNGQAYPPGYYFDENSLDTVSDSGANQEDETVSGKFENIENTEETLTNSEIMKNPAEIAQKRREGFTNFFKSSRERLVNTVSKVGNKISNFFGRVKENSLNVAFAPDAYVKKGYEGLINFRDKKAEQLSSFVKSRVDMAELIANFVKDRSVEKLSGIKDIAVSRYEGLRQFGNDTIESGLDKVRGVKESYRNKKNNFIIFILKSIEQHHRAKADKIAESINLLQSI